MNGIRLESERVILREWMPDDGDAMYRLMGDPDVTRFLSWGQMTPAQCARRLGDFIGDQRCRNRESRLSRWWHGRANEPIVPCHIGLNCHRGRYHLAIELKASSRVIGEIGFEWTSKRGAEAQGDVGYFLEKQFWERGYATEATRLVVSFAFATLGAGAVTAACDYRNLASERVMQKCGLERDRAMSQARTRVSTLTKSRWLSANSQPIRVAS